MARNYAALPYDYLEEMSELNDAEFGRLARALLKYSALGEPVALSGNERFYAKRVMAQEDRFKESYDEVRILRSEAGKKGMASRWNNKNNTVITSDNKNNNTKTNTETKTNTLLSDDNKSKGAQTRFTPPTVEEVGSYCRERGNSVDPERFVDFYAANGWKIGKNAMEDWQAAVRTWEKREERKDKSRVDLPTPEDVERTRRARERMGLT